MSLRQLWEGGSGDTWMGRLDGRTKLSFLFLYAFLMVLIDNPRTLFFLFTGTLLFHLSVRTPFYKWRMLLLFLLLGLWGSVASQALFFAQTPKTPLLTLIPKDLPYLGAFTGGLAIYKEGILYGAVQGMRSAAMISLGLLVCWTSDPRQLLRGLVAWKFPPQAAFMLVTAIRFFPVLAAEAGEVIIALRLRSKSESGRHGFVRYLPYVIKPLLARCLRRSQTLALSVVSRGLFLARAKSEAWDKKEMGATLLFFLLSLSAAAGKCLYALSEQGLYFGNLRFVYDWTKWYL